MAKKKETKNKKIKKVIKKPNQKVVAKKSKTIKKSKKVIDKDINTKIEKPSRSLLTFKNKTTIKKKGRKIERVATGIKNFDSFIEGGFEKNSTNLLVGSSGAGKSILATQFLISGMKKGEKCLYVTFEEKKQEFYDNMARLGWDLDALERQGKFVFLEYTPQKVKTMLEEGGGAIENIVLTKKISRIVIDSITSFELLFEKELDKRESSLALFNLIRKWDVTSLLTYEGAPSIERKESSRILDFESDSIIILYFPRGKKQRNRFLEVLKMRGTNHSLGIYPFTIEKSGINVSKQRHEGELYDRE